MLNTSTNGSNLKNVLSRKEKAVGVIKQIEYILNDICFGSFYFEVAIILRDSLFLNSILTNSEAWYRLRKHEIEILERCDENLLRKFVEAPCTTPKCMLYLEIGCKPARFLIMSRRLMFLHYILNEESSSLLSRFFKVQVKFPDRDDWCSVIFQDLEYLDIHLTFDQIQASSKQQFKKLVDQSINDKDFQFLIDEKNQLRKVSHIQYKKLTMQNYLKTKSVSIQMAKFIFILHSRMLDISEQSLFKSLPSL